ncbi:endonuclease/exonuclease/phosphatase family protein [Actinomadura miaoliensis]|uniref:Endonuclease/exonuclease/phosphatase family protein n=1 Tax=Actinomadura miaoliensis TaxID=430685 RepID=A0ABP7X7P1_9ACTN
MIVTHVETGMSDDGGAPVETISRPEAAAGQAGGRRWWVSAVLWAAWAPFAVWAVLRWGGWQPAFRWGQLVAFTPYVAAASPVVPVLAFVLRRRGTAVAGVLVACAFAVAVVPRAVPDGDPDARGPVVRVLAANVLYGRASPQHVVDLARRTRADVLTVQELTPQAMAALDRAGLSRVLPHRVVAPLPGGAGSGLYSRFPLSGRPAIAVGFRQVRAMVQVPGGPPVEVVSVHPCAPSHPGMARCWRDGLRALPRPSGRGPVRVLAGDFNATLDHAELRRLLRSGYRDAADATGDGLRWTWPAIGPHPPGMPPVTLDHVLADERVGVRASGVHRVPGTDHRAVSAVLVLPPR